MILSVQTPPARPCSAHHLCEGKGLKMNTSPDAVAMQYFEESQETEKRDADTIKRHFNDRLCNGMKKPTGKSGDTKTDLILRAQRVKLAILRNQAVGNVGCGAGGNSFAAKREDEQDEDVDDEDVDDDQASINADGSDLFGNEFQPNQLQADAAASGATSLGIIPNGPSAPHEPIGNKRPNSESSIQKTKSMKQSPRQGAGSQFAALGNTLQSVAASSTSAMMVQMMMQQQQQMQQQMQQQNQQNMQMMMMMATMMRGGSPSAGMSSSSSSSTSLRMLSQDMSSTVLAQPSSWLRHESSNQNQNEEK